MGRAAGALLGAVLLVAGCGSGPAGHFEKAHLGRLPALFKRGTVTTSADATRYTCVEQVRDGERVIDTGVAGPTFELVTPPYFAPRGPLLAYFGRSNVAGEKRVDSVGGGKVIPTRLSEAGPPTPRFGPDGTRWGVVGREVESAAGGEAAPPMVAVYVDGTGPAHYPDASLLAFSDDGKHAAYLVRDEAGRIALVVDGAVQRTYAEPEGKCSEPRVAKPGMPGLPPQFAVRYLADGSLLVITRDATCWTVWRGETRFAAYPNSYVKDPTAFVFDPELSPRPTIFPESLVVAEAAPMAAWWERLEGEPDDWRVVRDGVAVDDAVCLKAADDTPLVLSADGKHVLHTCLVSEEGEPRIFVVSDGVREGPYRFVWGLALSGDGRRHAYAAAQGVHDPWHFYVDGRQQAGGWETVFAPVLSHDGGHVAWAAVADNRIALVLDGRRLGTVDEVLRPPWFTAVGDLVWAVRRGRSVVRLTVLGQAMPPASGADAS